VRRALPQVSNKNERKQQKGVKTRQSVDKND
jgi:hypothetical protein